MSTKDEGLTVSPNGQQIDVTGRYSDEQLQELAIEMIFQMTGKKLKDKCRWQGDSDYQIAFYYLERINNGC